MVNRQRRDRTARPVRLGQGPQIEIGEVVGIEQARNISSSPTQARLAASVPALPSSSGSKAVRTAGGRWLPARALRWFRTTSGRWCRLTRTSLTPARWNASSQMSSRGCPPMTTMQFGVASVIGRSRLPTPAASRKAFMFDLPDDPEGTHPRVGVGQHPVQALHALKPRGVRRHGPGWRAPRFPAQLPQRADIGQAVPRVAEAVVPGHHSRLVRPILAHDDVREFPGGDRLTAANVEDPPGGAIVPEHQHIGVHHVLDVDVIPDRLAVLIKDRSLAEQIAQAEDAADTRVGVVNRLPGALDELYLSATVGMPYRRPRLMAIISWASLDMP